MSMPRTKLGLVAPDERAGRGADEPDEFTVAAAGGEEVVPRWNRIPELRRRALSAIIDGRTRQLGGDRHRWWVLGVMLCGLLSVNFTFTIFAVVLTEISRSFHTSGANTTWVITAPLLCFGVAAPILGRVGDRIGHRRLYLAGTSLTFVAAVLTALAPSIGFLIIARSLSGVVGAATGTASMALIFRAFEREDRVKAMGWWSLVGAGGPVVGVVIGGALVGSLGWRSIFWLQAGLILVSTLLAVLILPRGRRRATGERFDLRGGVLITIASLGLLLGLNRGPASGWTSPLVLASFLAVPIALWGFVRVERRAEQPLLPIEFLRRRNFSFAVLNQLFANFAYMGGFILTPMLLERIYGYSASSAGLTVVVRPLVFSLAAPLAGYAAARVGNRTAASAGAIALTASMATFVLASPASGLAPVFVGLALSGLAFGLLSPALAASVANSVTDDDLGSASAAEQLIGQIGTVAGIQVLQTVQASSASSFGMVGSFHAAFATAAAAGVVTAACAAGLVRRSRAKVVPFDGPHLEDLSASPGDGAARAGVDVAPAGRTGLFPLAGR
jgi:EmrB/QacA subfamily drug resistance transporter